MDTVVKLLDDTECFFISTRAMPPRIGIGIIVFNSKNEILLGKRISSHGESSYGNPGGHLEFSETFEEIIILL